MTMGSLSKPTSISEQLSISRLCRKLFARVNAGLLLVSKAFGKTSGSNLKLDREGKPVYEEAQQAGSKKLPEPFVSDTKLQTNVTGPLEPLQRPLATLPPLKTCVHARTTQGKARTESSADSDCDSPPDSPTEVLHWSLPSRAKSLPAVPLALALRFQQVLERERAARIAAEAAAVAAKGAVAAAPDSEELRRQLVDVQNVVASLRVVNKELQTEVDKLQSQIPSMEVAYEQLKGSFFKLQGRYGGAQARLNATLNEAACLRSQLQAFQAQGQ